MSAIDYRRNVVNQPIYIRQRKAENPFIDVSDSARLLSRLVIAVTILAGWLIGVMGKDAAPHVFPRLIVFTFYVLTITLPLWFKLPKIGILHPLFIISAYSFMKDMLPSLSLNSLGLSDHPFLGGVSSSQMAILHIEVIGLYAFAALMTYAGYYAVNGIQWRMLHFRGKNSIVIAVGLFSLIAGITGFLLLIDLSGGLYDHLKNITRGSESKWWVKDATYASAYATLCKLLSVPPALYLLKGKNPTRSPFFWILAFIAISTGYAVGGRRSGMAGPVVILVACWILRTKQLSIGRIGIIWFLLFLSVGILGEYRRSNWTASRRVNTAVFENTDFLTAVEMSWDELQGRKSGSPMYLIIKQVPNDVPYLYGVNYLTYINRFIPRRIWPDKPRGLATQCSEVFYGRFGSGAIPMGPVGEAYWSGGLFAVTIVFFIWGTILRSIGSFFIRFQHSSFACLLYLITLTRLTPSELGFGGWVYVVAPAAILLIMVGEMTPNLSGSRR